MSFYLHGATSSWARPLTPVHQLAVQSRSITMSVVPRPPRPLHLQMSSHGAHRADAWKRISSKDESVADRPSVTPSRQYGFVDTDSIPASSRKHAVFPRTCTAPHAASNEAVLTSYTNNIFCYLAFAVNLLDNLPTRRSSLHTEVEHKRRVIEPPPLDGFRH